MVTKFHRAVKQSKCSTSDGQIEGDALAVEMRLQIIWIEEMAQMHNTGGNNWQDNQT